MREDGADGASSGFDSAPQSRTIPRSLVLRDSENVATPARVPIRAYSKGFYRLKYLLEPRVSVHPLSFTEPVAQDGPYELNHMWTTKSFHHSML